MTTLGSAGGGSSLFGGGGSTGGSSLFGGGGAAAVPSLSLGSTAGGSLFGGAAGGAGTGGGGLFGGGGGAAPTPTIPSLSLGSLSGGGGGGGGGLFGTSSTTQQQQQPAQQTSSLGGGLGGGGLFGAPTSSSSLFPSAQPQQQQPTQQTSSLFAGAASSLAGPPSSTSLFGQPQQQQQQSSLFQQPQQTQQLQQSSLFATPQQQQQLQQQQLLQQQQQQQTGVRTVETKIAELIQSINPESPNCKFLYWFFNYAGQKLDPSKIPKPTYLSDEQWTYINSQNPDPTMFVAVAARSFDDLIKRKTVQKLNIDKLHESTIDTLKHIKELQNYLNLQIQSQLETMRKKNIELLHKYIEVWSKVECYNGKAKSVTSAEEQLLRRVKMIGEALSQPSTNSIKNRVEELSNQLIIRNMAQRDNVNFQLDTNSLESLYTVFKNMTAAIENMSSDLENSLQDAEILKNELAKLRQ
ncbi:nucleoporin 54 [Cavenderia fasciculata]|uniref:Nucleoporin 54 n=1 Tax=Cavenderia fasciculata TaxID=261658 RepID=F4PSE1_CACFS|nr:nucleoporin 54 [Cavenderia fasciculata]EGG20687.1 nucleoporin 54 [Cavenderia fasciculata]|eukprot:XP_004358537.1 nucleoporin 54 [Cavenderia fasciculata]